MCPSIEELYFHTHILWMMLIYSTWLLLSQKKQTALHYASEGGHHDTVRVLLERDADPNVHNKVSSV